MCEFISWPILPKQITNDKEFGFKDPGIIPNKYLKGILVDMTLKLKHPITFIEFLNGKYFRTEGDTPKINHKPSCLGKECEDAGCFYYKICSQKFIEKIESLDSIIRKSDCEEISKLFFDNGFSVSENEGINTTAILGFKAYSYICKKNKLLEYAIPIFYQGILLGILFVGNIKNDQSLIKSLKIELGVFYKTLFVEIEEIAKNYAAKKIESVNWALRDDFFLNPLPQGNQRLIRFWKKVENSLKLLLDVFPAEFFIVLAKDSFTAKNGSEILKGVSSEGYNLKHTSIIFNPSKIESYQTLIKPGQLNITSSNCPELANGISATHLDFNPETDILRLFPSHYSPRSSYMIWIRYNKNKWDRIGDIEKKYSHDEIFENAILSFYSLLGSIYSSVLAEISSELFELTIRVIGHELSQNLVVIDAIRQYYIEEGQIFNKSHKLKDINEDLKSQITQIEYIDLNSKSILKKERKIEISEIQPIKDLIYKWTNTYKKFGKKRKVLFVTQDYIHSTKYPSVNTDPMLIDQVVYNVINNALKYCHFGTNIYCDYYKSTDNPSNVVISITDYGKTEPPESRIIYDLFERGENLDGIEGLGIGLGIAKQNLSLIEGSIRHEIKEISKYNIPVLVYYVQNSGSFPKIANFEKYITEFNSLKEDSISRIIAKEGNTFMYKPGYAEIMDTINNPTIEVTFSIEFNFNLKKKEK